MQLQSGSSTSWLDELIVEHLQQADQVQRFADFEELCKLYSIDAPFASRSQVELMFDVYDGSRMQLAADENQQQSTTTTDQDQEQENYHLKSPEEAQTTTTTSRRRQNSIMSLRRRGRQANFSWCKLFSSFQSRAQTTCCMRSSETGLDLNLSSSSSVQSSFARTILATDEDEDDERELRSQVVRLMAPLMNEVRRSSELVDSGASSDQLAKLEGQPQQVLLDGCDFGRISICLFDKRARQVEFKCEAENGRRWAQIEQQLRELRLKFRSAKSRRQLEGRIRASIFRLGRRPVKRHIKKGDFSFVEKLAKEQIEELVELSKTSINHLIDAQLLLRNKLSSEQQQQASRGFEYETLMKNNFNLLKIWQNLEETKRLVCFVCEPIKANLADLFSFNRQRASQLPASSMSRLLISPLVSLDAVQVKQGLLQVSLLVSIMFVEVVLAS